MKYGKYISLFSAIMAVLISITDFYFDKNGWVWLNVAVWSMSTFFCELNLERKEKEVENLKSKKDDSKEQFLNELDVLAKEISNDMDFGYTVRKFLNSRKD